MLGILLLIALLVIRTGPESPIGTALRLRVRGPEQSVLAQFKELLPPGTPVTVVQRVPDLVEYRVDAGSATAPVGEALARLVVKNGWDLLELLREKATLEDVFRKLTLRAEQEALHA